MDPLLLCCPHDVFACVVTAMHPILLCYLHYAKDPILFCYLHDAFLCVVLCFCMWVYLRSAYKHKYAREYAELIMWNEIRDKQVREYQDREIRMKKIHDENVEIVRQVQQEIAKETEDKLCGTIKSLKSELANLRSESECLIRKKDDALILWIELWRHTKAHAWVPEFLPTSQAGSP